MSKINAFFSGVLCGSVAGAALAVLYAPKSGAEIRQNLADASDNLYRRAAYELEELTNQIEELGHKADVIEATLAIKSEPKIVEAKESVISAAQTTAESQQLLAQQVVPPQSSAQSAPQGS